MRYMMNLEHLYEFRKKLHRTPEIAFQEFKTQQTIIDELNAFKGLKMIKFEPTGLLVEYSHGEGDYLLFRADMDALPIQENTECDFQSENEGVFHACGHDIHMTALVGLIHYVVENELKMNLLFFFQPAEEGHGGAMHIINTGVFEGYKIKSAYALHVTGAYPTGSIGVKSGIIFGIPQEFDIEFIGKSGHVSSPQKGRDAFLAAISYYEAMKKLVDLRFPAQEPVLFHIGKASAGTVRNIIPEYCKLEGTFRCLNNEVKNDIIALMNTVAKSFEHSHEVEIKVSLLSSYDPVVNDEYLTDKLIEHLPTTVSHIDVDYSMTGEDFGFFSGMYPSVLFWLGTNSNEDLHSSKFLPDEKSIDTALEVYKSILDSYSCQQ